MENKDITKIVENEIREKSLDLTIDYAEIAIDELITSEVLKEIPIVKSIVSFYNIGNSIVNRHNTKKLLCFFQEFNSKKIDELKMNRFRHRFNSDETYRSSVVETIILLNERFLHVEKSKILANLILAHINENLTWEELTDITVVLDNIHPKGFKYLQVMSKTPYWSIETINPDNAEGLMFACGIGKKIGTMFFITPMGQKLYEFGVDPATP